MSSKSRQYIIRLKKQTEKAELEKWSFSKCVKISPEIHWYHYRCPCPAPTCIVRHQKFINTPISCCVTSEPTVPSLFPICLQLRHSSPLIFMYPISDLLEQSMNNINHIHAPQPQLKYKFSQTPFIDLPLAEISSFLYNLQAR